MTNETKGSAPVDRTRAIVEAASELARAAGAHVDSNGFVETRLDHTVGVPSFVYPALDKITRALALPEPEWTTTPPMEPGTYLATLNGQVFTLQLSERGTFEDCCFEDTPEAMRRAGYRFWPVPLTPPPA